MSTVALIGIIIGGLAGIAILGSIVFVGVQTAKLNLSDRKERPEAKLARLSKNDLEMRKESNEHHNSKILSRRARNEARKNMYSEIERYETKKVKNLEDEKTFELK